MFKNIFYIDFAEKTTNEEETKNKKGEGKEEIYILEEKLYTKPKEKENTQENKICQFLFLV